MSRLSSSAPQIGAALAAGLMILSAMAFDVGVPAESKPVSSATADPAQTGGDDHAFFAAAVTTAPGLRAGAPGVDAGLASGVPAPLDIADLASPPRLAVIIDDVADLETADAIWSLGIPVTLAILPYADQSQLIATRAGTREIFLHLPMEPVGLQDPGPYALTKTLAGDSLSARVRWALDQVPGAAGFNNHMGSRLTADETMMAQVFDALDGHQDRLIFVDSLTHPGSVAREMALQSGFQAFDRDIFLDHDPAAAAIEAQLQAALDRAVTSGQAIAIGHPRPETLAALQDLADKADAAGVEIVPIAALRPG